MRIIMENKYSFLWNSLLTFTFGVFLILDGRIFECDLFSSRKKTNYLLKTDWNAWRFRSNAFFKTEVETNNKKLHKLCVHGMEEQSLSVLNGVFFIIFFSLFWLGHLTFVMSCQWEPIYISLFKLIPFACVEFVCLFDALRVASLILIDLLSNWCISPSISNRN